MTIYESLDYLKTYNMRRITPELMSTLYKTPEDKTQLEIESAKVENKWADMWMDEYIKDVDSQLGFLATEEAELAF